MLKSDNSSIVNYFNSNPSISLQPLISAEWNYNSIYQPYVTFSGDGENLAKPDVMMPVSWTIESKYTAVTQSTDSYTTSAFPAPRKCLDITKTRFSIYDNYSDNTQLNLDKANWFSKIKTTIPVPSGNNCYKIIFYAKSVENNIINLTATATHPDITTNISYSSFEEIDDVEWKKIEILFGVKPSVTGLGRFSSSPKIPDPSYSNINISIDLTNTTYSKQNWSVLIDRFEVYQITYFDFMYGSLWRSDSVFSPFRPGESYVPSGNSNCTFPTNFRKVITGAITYDNNGNSINWLDNPTGNAWNPQMPCSPATYSPKVLFGFHSNPLYKNGMISPFSRYKYFVSDNDASSTSIGATYEENMKINKIVLKFNISQSKPEGAVLRLYKYSSSSTNELVHTINIQSSDIDDSGTCVLYYTPTEQKEPSNRQWTKTKWNADNLPIIDKKNFGKFIINNKEIAITAISGNGSIVTYWTPTLPPVGTKVLINGATVAGFNGEFTVTSNITDGGNRFTVNNTTQGTSSTALYYYPAYEEINKMVLTQTSSSLANADYDLSLKEDVKQEFHRMHLVEMSPRLEIDMSSLVINFDIVKELDNKSNLVPISAISSNSANISFTNIPWAKVGTANDPLFLFSSNSTLSPLKNMLVKNVKFYINYIITNNTLLGAGDGPSRTIPAGVFYADTWDTKDIETTTVNCFDITKYLQLLPVNDYVTAGGQSLLKVMTNLLDFSGFTDYDYDQLANICINNKKNLTISYFFADSKNKTVFDVLREIFTAYQVGAYIDEYGVMKFLNLINLTKNNVKTFDLSDGNIATKGYDETVKTKIGKLIFRYKTPQITKTISTNSDVQSYFTELTPQPDIVWKQDVTQVVPFTYLGDSILSESQHFFDLSINNFESVYHGLSLDSSGYCIVEGEILSIGDKQIRFYTKDGSNKSQDLLIKGYDDLQSAIAQYSYNANFSNISYQPTGRIANVKRGLFNSKAKPHIVMKTVEDVKSKFDFTQTKKTIIGGSIFEDTNITSSTPPPPSIYNLITVPQEKNIRTYVIAKDSKSQYLTYSAKFKFDRISNAQTSAGIFMYLPRNSDKTAIIGNTYFVEIEKSTTEWGDDSHTRRLQALSYIYANTTYKLNIYYVSILGTKLDLITSKNITPQINEIYENQPSEDYIFNKDFLNLRCVIDDNNNLLVFINKKQIIFENDNVSVTPNPLGEFGFFTNGNNLTTTSVTLSEIYACEKQIINPNIYYHFQDSRYLDSLILNNQVPIRYYMVQSKPEVIGLNFYDVQLAIAPILGAEPYKVSYRLVEKQAVDNNAAQTLDVKENALAYSNIINSGFRAKFVVVNNSPYAVWTKVSSDQINSDFGVATQYLLSFGPEKNIQKDIDNKNNELLEIQSDWVQSEELARSVANTIALAVDNFSKDTTVNLFGNPLIQIGDVALVNYSLLNIVNQKYFVQSVRQTFNQGLTTSLTMNKITYTGDSTQNSIVYVPPKTLPSATISTPAANNATSTSVPGQVDANTIQASGNISITWAPVKDATSYYIKMEKVNRTLSGTLIPNGIQLTSGTTNRMKIGETIVQSGGSGNLGTGRKVSSIVDVKTVITSPAPAGSGSVIIDDPIGTLQENIFTVLNYPKTSYINANSPFNIPKGKSLNGNNYDAYQDGDRIKITIQSYNSASQTFGTISDPYYYIVQPGTPSAVSYTPLNVVAPRIQYNANDYTGELTITSGRWENVDVQPDEDVTAGQTRYFYQWQQYDGTGDITQDSSWYDLGDQIGEVSSSDLIFQYENLTQETAYRFLVTAINGYGTGSPLSSDTIKSSVAWIHGTPPLILNAPTNVQAFIRYDGKIVVSWTDAVGNPVTYYKVTLISPKDDVRYEVEINSGVGQAIIDPTNGVSRVQVTSLDSKRNTSNQVSSNSVSVIPINQTIDNFIASGNLNLSWNAVQYATSYVIKISTNISQTYGIGGWIMSTDKTYTNTISSMTISGYPNNTSLLISIYAIFPGGVTGPVFSSTYVTGSPAPRKIGRGVDE